MQELSGDVTVIVAVAIVVGVIGTVIPVIPGGVLIVAAVALWAFVAQTTGAWVVLVLVTLLIVAGAVLKYLTAGKRMIDSQVPRSSLLLGGLLAIPGFFVIPGIGLVVGFVGGLALAEYRRLDDWAAARSSSVLALKAVGIAILVELGAALLAAVTWFVAVWRGVGG